MQVLVVLGLILVALAVANILGVITESPTLGQVLRVLAFLFGAGMTALGLWELFSPSSARNRFCRQSVQGLARIRYLWTKELKDSYGKIHHTYFFEFWFTAEHPVRLPREVHLSSRVDSWLFQRLKEGQEIQVRYLPGNPRMVVFEWEVEEYCGRGFS